jgi:Na+/phosphate symporter
MILVSNLAEEMSKLADGAVEVAENSYKLILNYSVDSLKNTEEIFTSLHKEVPKNFLAKISKRGLTEEQINLAALMLGAYVGEVIRRIHGGEWIREDVMGEKDVITLKLNGSSIFPVGKAYKRIKNGSEDDICFYYKVLTTEILK